MICNLLIYLLRYELQNKLHFGLLQSTTPNRPCHCHNRLHFHRLFEMDRKSCNKNCSFYPLLCPNRSWAPLTCRLMTAVNLQIGQKQMCPCVCLCVCVSEREREREREYGCRNLELLHTYLEGWHCFSRSGTRTQGQGTSSFYPNENGNCDQLRDRHW